MPKITEEKKIGVDYFKHEGMTVSLVDVIIYQETGSRYICNPPVMNTDADLILLVEDREAYGIEAGRWGFGLCGKYESHSSNFDAYRVGVVNLIVTDNLVWYFRFAAATELAKQMNILEKSNRIDLFHTILEGEEYLKNKEEYNELLDMRS